MRLSSSLQEELRPTPDLRCTKWCRFVFFGLECNDARCPYAHSQEELQPQPPEFKTTLCRFAKRGKCLNGDNCRYDKIIMLFRFLLLFFLLVTPFPSLDA